LVKKYKKIVKKNMVSLNVYKAEFETLINVYSGLLAQYDILTERLVSQEFNIEVETQRGGSRKSATATAQEKLRSDLVTYSDRLMLNPKTLLNAKLKANEKESNLSKLISEIDRGR
jgi:hypothetical protein